MAQQDQRGGQRPAAGGESTALAIPTGTISRMDELIAAVNAMRERVHLTSPVALGSIPQGYGIAFTCDYVDPDEDTYVPQKKKDGDGEEDEGRRGQGQQQDDKTGLALKGQALLRIAGSRGVTEVVEKSGREDDGSDPHYCRTRWVGKVQLPDGQWLEEKGTKEIDLRDDSTEFHELYNAALRKETFNARRYGRQIDREAVERRFDAALTQLRKHIVAMCESKARNRALRVLCGLKATYTRAELAKPFVAIKPVFTGRFDDPELSKYAAARIVDQALGQDSGATAMLFGPRRHGQLPAPVVNIGHQGTEAPRPVGEARPVDDSIEAMADALEAGSLPPGAVGPEETAPAKKNPPPPKPRPFAELPEDQQIAALLELAQRKGRLGENKDQVSEAWIRKNATRRAELYGKLEQLPDDDTPDFMR